MNRTQYSIKLGLDRRGFGPAAMQGPQAKDLSPETSSTFIKRRSFADVRHCPVVDADVAITGIKEHVAGGTGEVVKKTCAAFLECYQGQLDGRPLGSVVLTPGCLLANPEE